MSIHFISGKPGGGKTLYALKLIIEELAFGTRCVITNVAIKLPELNEYLQKAHPSKTINLFERVKILEDEQAWQFFRYRPNGLVLPDHTKDMWEKGQTPDYSAVCDSGVLYVIDEIHIGFNARAWMKTGQSVIYYLSQHRKLGDTVLCITQAIGNVDKQFRSVTQDFTYLRNVSKERMGLFSLPSVFIRRTYGEPYSANAVAMETGTFKLDVTGIANCYDTAKGVGIHGRAGDTGEKKKGLHWSVLAIGIPLFVALLVWGLPKLVSHFFRPRIPERKPVAVSVTTTNETPVPKKGFLSKSRESEQTTVATNELPRFRYYRSLDKLTGIWRVVTDTGEVFWQGSPEVELIHKDFIIIAGEKYLPHPEPRAADPEMLPRGNNYVGTVTPRHIYNSGTKKYLLPAVNPE